MGLLVCLGLGLGLTACGNRNPFAGLKTTATPVPAVAATPIQLHYPPDVQTYVDAVNRLKVAYNGPVLGPYGEAVALVEQHLGLSCDGSDQAGR